MKKNVFLWAVTLMNAVMAMFGGVAVAAFTPGEHGSDTDPNAGKPAEGAVKDSPEKGAEQPGGSATGSALDDAELVENQVRDYVDKFRAHRFPLAHDIGQLARQIKVDTKEPTNFEVGEAVLEAKTKAAVVAADQETYTLQLFGNDVNTFPVNSTILVDGVEGYNFEGTAKDGNPLVLIVTGKSANPVGVIVEAVNGKQSGTGSYKYIDTTIPAGTKVYVMAPALTESEVEMEPDNILPMERKCYLQKKVCAITYTELFERIKKKAKWNVQDVKDAALDRYRRKYTRSKLISAPSKFVRYNPRTGNEYGYTEKGILRQMRLGYQIQDGQLDFNDLVAIQAAIFGKYDTGKEADAYCGTMFIKRLLNIDFKKHNEINIRQYTDEKTKIKITSFESNFGTLNFKHEYGLDELGFSECCFITKIQEAKHFYYENGKTINIDHSKGEGGEVREAKSQYYIQDDCLELGGFNNMIVGPSVLISGYKLSALDLMVSVNKLSEITTPTDGMLAYLIEDYTDSVSGTSYKMGLYKYDATATEWKVNDGKEIYIA